MPTSSLRRDGAVTGFPGYSPVTGQRNAIPLTYDANVGRYASQSLGRPILYKYLSTTSIFYDGFGAGPHDPDSDHLFVPNARSMMLSGLTPQVYMEAFIENSGASASYLTAYLYEVDNNGIFTTPEIGVGPIISFTPGIHAGEFKMSGWQDLTGLTPTTREHGMLALRGKVDGGTGYFGAAHALFRWTK